MLKLDVINFITMNKSTLFFLFCLITPFITNAQWLTGLQSYYSDDFREWTIFTDDEEVEGELNMRWKFQNDWSEWDYTIGDLTGTIRATFANDPSQFEIRGDGNTITARRLFANDFREWRITNNETTIVFKTKWGNTTDEWTVRDNKKGEFSMKTAWTNDPRDWEIEDYLDDDVNLQMKVAMVFIAMYHSVPKD